MGQTKAAPLPTSQLERALGSNVLSGVANRLGLPPALVSTAVGYALPKIIGLLTPRGVIPTSLPSEVANFLSQPRAPGAPAPSAAQVAPRRIEVYHTPDARSRGMTRWLWPVLAALVLLAFGFFFWPTGNQKTRVPPPIAQAPPASQAPPTVAQAPPAAPAPPTAGQAPAPPTAAPRFADGRRSAASSAGSPDGRASAGSLNGRASATPCARSSWRSAAASPYGQ